MERISAKEYCIEKNILSILTQCDISENNKTDLAKESYASHKKIWWQCDKGHKWQGTISDRLMKGAGCPYCANKKVLTGYNDLVTLYPEVAQEWHPTKNGSLTPDKVIPGSDRVVWWQCKEGHEWRAAISNRALKKHSCPFCSGKRAWPGFNDLATLHPELMKEWHPTLNEDLDPTKLRPASAKRAWWMCSRGHVWDSYIFNRTSKTKSGCPICAGNQKPSKQAQWIAKAQEREAQLRKRRLPMNYEMKLIMEKINDSFVCDIDGTEMEYENGNQAIEKLTERYVLQTLGVRDGKLLLKLTKNTKAANDVEADWAKEYKNETGEEVSFF